MNLNYKINYYKKNWPIFARLIPAPIRKIIWYIDEQIYYFQLKKEGSIYSWTKFKNDPRIPNNLRIMIEDYIKFVNSNPDNVSKPWIQLGLRHVEQLIYGGDDNFKQTLAFKYFTVRADRNQDILQFLIDNNDKNVVEAARIKSENIPPPTCFSSENGIKYNFTTLLLWKYALKIGLDKYLDRLSEPLEGNPLSILIGDKNITQDLINSTIEFSSIIEYPYFSKIKTIAEIGGGGGRDAFVFLKLAPQIRYVMIDIPPALYIQQQYLSSQFPNKKIFRYRHFDSFQEVEKEFNESDLIFLMSNQIEKLPPKTIDGCIAIDCLHEMSLMQINWYFEQVNRITKRFFYFKCWKDNKGHGEEDAGHLGENKYPISPEWKKIYSRQCRVQPKYFEALYDLGSLD